MAVRPLRVMPDDDVVLRTPAAAIPRVTDGIRTLARDLLETMRAHEGVGLAAPQIGCGLQMFVTKPVEDHPQLIVINPRLEAGAGRAAVVEGCLSIPEVWEEIPRWARVRLHGCDLTGRPIRLEAEGLLAIVIQHEVDHLQGRLISDPHAHRRLRHGRLCGAQP